METFKKYLGWIMTGITSLIGLLFYIISKKNKEIKDLKVRIDQVTTEKEADIIEVEIKQLKQNKDNFKKTTKELDKALEKVQEKREQVAKDARELKGPKEIAEYWENN